MATATVDGYIKSLESWQVDAAKELRRIIHASVPEVREDMKWGQPTYEHHGLLCYLKGFKSHMKVGLFHGSYMEDPAGMLDGTGTKLRHIKLQRVEDNDDPGLASLLASAAVNRSQSSRSA